MACAPLNISAMRSIADRVEGSGSAGILSVCQALGSMTVCMSFCQALEQDKCWNHYVAQIATDTVNPGGTLTAWMVLQAARDQCSTSILSGNGGRPNWAAIEPLERPYQYESLCACAWPDELPLGFLATHPGARVASRLVYRSLARPPPPPFPAQATRRTSRPSVRAVSMAHSASSPSTTSAITAPPATPLVCAGSSPTAARLPTATTYWQRRAHGAKRSGSHRWHAARRQPPRTVPRCSAASQCTPSLTPPYAARGSNT